MVRGSVIEQATREPMPMVKVSFYGTKISTLTDSIGQFKIETYYPVDSIQVYSLGYKVVRKKIKADEEQEMNFILKPISREVNEIVVLPPDEFHSTILHKKIIAHKPVNNKEKLQAYQY